MLLAGEGSIMSVRNEEAAIRPFTIPVTPEVEIEALRARVRAAFRPLR